MGVIHIDLFTTLDGVAQAPGGPEEDAEGGFAFGGWQAPLIDESIGEQVLAGIVELDALLLGSKTYDIFANYWPHQNDVRHLRQLLPAQEQHDRRRLQQGSEVRRVPRQPDTRMERLDTART